MWKRFETRKHIVPLCVYISFLLQVIASPFLMLYPILLYEKFRHSSQIPVVFFWGTVSLIHSNSSSMGFQIWKGLADFTEPLQSLQLGSIWLCCWHYRVLFLRNERTCNRQPGARPSMMLLALQVASLCGAWTSAASCDFKKIWTLDMCIKEPKKAQDTPYLWRAYK